MLVKAIQIFFVIIQKFSISSLERTASPSSYYWVVYRTNLDSVLVSRVRALTAFRASSLAKWPSVVYFVLSGT